MLTVLNLSESMFVIFNRSLGLNNIHFVDKDLINISLIAKTRLGARGSDLKIDTVCTFDIKKITGFR